ncbi:MAG: hypothetical protein GY943_26250, partial [Chloroflexi bacterium]|nr:hypothetical protein [Chloroflexota bacterium]
EFASGSADGTVILWNADTGQPAHVRSGHSYWVRSVAWSPDGQLASGSSDGTVILWNTDTGQPAQTLSGHSGTVLSVAWSPDGQLASGSDDGTVIIVPNYLTHPPCEWALRNLTEDEWITYQGIFQVYQPTCPNLPSPILTNPMLSWSGRLQWGGLILVGLLVVYLILLGLWKGVRRLFHKKTRLS